MFYSFHGVCSSVTKLCPNLCDPMNFSTQASLLITNSRRFLRLMSTEVAMPSNHLVLHVSFSSYPQSLPASGSFPISWLFASGGQSVGVSVSVSVLPMNIQGWFPFGLTSLNSLLSKGLSRVFSNTTISVYIYKCFKALLGWSREEGLALSTFMFFPAWRPWSPWSLAGKWHWTHGRHSGSCWEQWDQRTCAQNYLLGVDTIPPTLSPTSPWPWAESGQDGACPLTVIPAKEKAALAWARRKWHF